MATTRIPEWSTLINALIRLTNKDAITWDGMSALTTRLGDTQLEWVGTYLSTWGNTLGPMPKRLAKAIERQLARTKLAKTRVRLAHVAG